MTRCSLPLLLIVVLVGCGGRDEPPGAEDAGRADAGAIDAQVEDSGSVSDADVDDGGAADGGAADAATDAAADGGASDAGAQPDAGSSCGPTLGLPCTEACAAGFTCVNEHCVPERTGCGGFAGAECAEPFCCSYPDRSSAGICVTPQESACLESRAPGEFATCT